MSVYVRLEHGDRWHRLTTEGRPDCRVPGKVVETRESADVPAEDRCGNCDNSLRINGRKEKPPKKYKKPSKSEYKPKNREKF